ncbi:MAG: 4Fe-4S binding protein [Clostridia bacterium]|nr:4Fe-4S binding protein [Clostridia bacterium]
MNKADFEKALGEYIRNSSENYVDKEIALKPDLAGMQIFNEPLFGYASADDLYFTEAKKPGIIGAHFMTPSEWLPGAKTVIALFLPFTEQVRTANRQNLSWPADEWLHARIEGQAFQNKICRFAEDLLKKEGFAALTPLIDPRFKTGNPLASDKKEQNFYSSNWSERHAAYAAGLGTFGLSKGLITRKGVAGRYLSIVTSAVFEPDKRPYTGVYDYCNNCGACMRNCPASAISKEKGKNHCLCSEFLDTTKAKHAPRYGCGKCQVKVPCEDKAPGIGP